MLQQVRDLFSAEPVTLDLPPPDLKSAWVAPNGEVRIEVAPKGDANDNRVLRRFVEAVRKAAPQATGTPVFIVEAAATIVKAFFQAAALSLVSIAMILFVVLRRMDDVALTLVPLLVAIVVTLEICVAMACSSTSPILSRCRSCSELGSRSRSTTSWRGGRERRTPASQRSHGRSCSAPDHGDRLRQPLVFQPPGNVEHGQVDGAVAGDDPLRRRAVPARASGHPGKTRFKIVAKLRFAWVLWQNSDSRGPPALLA